MKKFREYLSLKQEFRSISTRVLVMLLGIRLLFWLAIVPPANAAPCRIIGTQTVCISEIKRSAKYPWEYRVTLSQDGAKQPQEILNCRDGKQFSPQGNRRPVNSEAGAVLFQTKETGEWICQPVKRN
ncbi:hypothetical protein [Leptolyngbya sp. FACHB-711]|uniref:hypothetical protein n=1 Tax=Leptolyngbya sp. FACHB-711 TaxID=2692813 RepID=UPI0016866334|nr:hypothetical protein [Leptolyngbya sp. FACHB-711]MBD2026538.1 hypothetical protein [Leptolyngbya sp. FACHB-711]